MKANFYDFDDTLAIQNWAAIAKNQLAKMLSMEQSLIYSLENATPLRSIERMKKQHDNGELVYILTARKAHETFRIGIQKFLQKYGINIRLIDIYMVGGAGEPKANMLRQIMPHIDHLEFHDDLYENIEAVNIMASEFPNVVTQTFWIQD